MIDINLDEMIDINSVVLKMREKFKTWCEEHEISVPLVDLFADNRSLLFVGYARKRGVLYLTFRLENFSFVEGSFNELLKHVDTYVEAQNYNEEVCVVIGCVGTGEMSYDEISYKPERYMLRRVEYGEGHGSFNFDGAYKLITFLSCLKRPARNGDTRISVKVEGAGSDAQQTLRSLGERLNVRVQTK